jgi:hypothetical protein
LCDLFIRLLISKKKKRRKWLWKTIKLRMDLKEKRKIDLKKIDV